ncbi:MAG: hypothetical protein R3Y67_10525 [Eubacteriales bacterium]
MKMISKWTSVKILLTMCCAVGVILLTNGMTAQAAPAAPAVTETINTYVPPAWVPTEPADIYRYSLVGGEDPFYQVVTSMDTIRMVIDVQGPLFFDAVALIQGDYTLGRTYNIFVNNILTYYNGNNVKIELQIPESLQEEGRTFRMFGVSEDGAVAFYSDLDNDPTTITFETNKFYAFVLGYVD